MKICAVTLVAALAATRGCAFMTATHPIRRSEVGSLSMEPHALTEYFAKSHEEKLRAVKAVEEKKDAEIQQLKQQLEELKNSPSGNEAGALAIDSSDMTMEEMATDLLQFQEFMAAYIVEAHLEKLEAVRAAELAIQNEYEEKLRILTAGAGNPTDTAAVTNTIDSPSSNVVAAEKTTIHNQGDIANAKAPEAVENTQFEPQTADLESKTETVNGYTASNDSIPSDQTPLEKVDTFDEAPNKKGSSPEKVLVATPPVLEPKNPERLELYMASDGPTPGDEMPSSEQKNVYSATTELSKPQKKISLSPTTPEAAKTEQVDSHAASSDSTADDQMAQYEATIEPKESRNSEYVAPFRPATKSEFYFANRGRPARNPVLPNEVTGYGRSIPDRISQGGKVPAFSAKSPSGFVPGSQTPAVSARTAAAPSTGKPRAPTAVSSRRQNVWSASYSDHNNFFPTYRSSKLSDSAGRNMRPSFDDRLNSRIAPARKTSVARREEVETSQTRQRDSALPESNGPIAPNFQGRPINGPSLAERSDFFIFF